MVQVWVSRKVMHIPTFWTITYYLTTYNEWKQPDKTTTHNTRTQQTPQIDEKHYTNWTEFFVEAI